MLKRIVWVANSLSPSVPVKAMISKKLENIFQTVIKMVKANYLN